jgi:hypothetical protein
MRNFNFDEIKKEKLESNVIAEGEKTGHKHTLVGKDFMLYKNLEEECLLLKVLGKEVELKHQEHLPVKNDILLPGNYKIENIIEYDHFREEAKKVQD